VHCSAPEPKLDKHQKDSQQ